MRIKLLFLDARIGISHAISRVDDYSPGSRHCYLGSRSPVVNSRGQSLERTMQRGKDIVVASLTPPASMYL